MHKQVMLHRLQEILEVFHHHRHHPRHLNIQQQRLQLLEEQLDKHRRPEAFHHPK